MKKLGKTSTQIAFLLSLVTTLGSLSNAQEPGSKCPMTELILPAGMVQIEQEVNLTIRTSSDFNSTTGEVEWKTSSGRILKGQGSPMVTFIADEKDEGSNIRISAVLKGLPAGCVAEVSDVLGIAQLPIGEPVETLEKVGRTKNARMSFLGRLDSYIAMLQNDPEKMGIVTVEFESRDSRGHKIKHLKDIINQFNFRNVELARITFAVSEVEHPERTTLWTYSPGARLPKYARDFTKFSGQEFDQKISELFQGKK